MGFRYILCVEARGVPAGEEHSLRPHHKLGLMIKRATLALVVLVGTAIPAMAEDEPAAVVARLNDALLAAMRSAEDGAGFEERYDALQPVLDDAFAFPAMARLAVGPRWNDLAPAERDRVAALFGEMSVATFAARFDGFSGERFEIVEEAPGPRGTTLVRSSLRRPADEPVGLDYLLREQEGGWGIIDVFLNSKFSEIARQRAEFAALLRQGGAPALIAGLEAKIEELRG